MIAQKYFQFFVILHSSHDVKKEGGMGTFRMGTLWESFGNLPIRILANVSELEKSNGNFVGSF
jgi:hypothetical protein